MNSNEIGHASRYCPEIAVALDLGKPLDVAWMFRQQEDDSLYRAATDNVGFGHLEDARRLAQAQGDDPDRWTDVRRYLPLLSDPEWHEQSRHGYARGGEPVAFVQNIRRYYDVLVWIDQHTLPDPLRLQPRVPLIASPVL